MLFNKYKYQLIWNRKADADKQEEGSSQKKRFCPKMMSPGNITDYICMDVSHSVR